MKLYDTLLAAKSDFHPIGDEVKLYVCGVTPYAEAHVGHAMSYVIFDVLRRYLEYQGMVSMIFYIFTNLFTLKFTSSALLGSSLKFQWFSLVLYEPVFFC